MIDFISYVIQELKAKRLSKGHALDLVQQFSDGHGKLPLLHPLLQQNTADLEQQSYGSRFDGSEFFLNDHRVGHGDSAQKVLPGVAYLEMARAAITQALPQARGTVVLTDVVWLQPMVVSAPTHVSIGLYADENGAVVFEILTAAAQQPVIHCQGKATVIDAELPEPINVAALQGQMNLGDIDASQIYPSYRQMGVNFGPGHQGVVKVLQGDGQLLAQLQLPNSVADSYGDYLLHPSLLDSALQAAIGFFGDLTELPQQASLPFALSAIHCYGPCPKAPLAWIRHAIGSNPGKNVSKLDIDLCDDHGNICVQLRGFTSRVLPAQLSDSGKVGTLLSRPQWLDIVTTDIDAKPTRNLPQFTLLAAKKPQPLLTDSQLISGDDYQSVALGCLAAVKQQLKIQRQGQWSLRLVIPLEGPWLGLAGLLRTAALENPKVTVQIIQTDADGQLLVEQLQRCGNESVIRFDGNQAKAMAWIDCDCHWDEAAPVAFAEQGVYLITGGLGGLGVVFAKEILRQTNSAKVILTGRAAKTALQDSLKQRQAVLDALDQGKGRVQYLQLDLTDAKAVQSLVNDIVKGHGRLNGILHSAGMNADSFILNKTAAQMSAVLAPKVNGAINLDAATANVDLDFLVLFSSGAAVLGNPGQADYAVANGFMDQFAAARNAKLSTGERRGQTLSINWPLWQDGGMSVDAATAARMYQATGMQPMPSSAGMAAFYHSLQLQVDQTLVMQGELNRLRLALNDAEPAAIEPEAKQQIKQQVAPPTTKAPVLDKPVLAPIAGDLSEQTRVFLRKELSGLLKMPAAKIDPQAQLEQYGIDSILTMDLTNKLEKTFGSLSKTLFFEYQTINELVQYFLDNHSEVLSQMFAVAQAPAVTAPTTSTTETSPVAARPIEYAAIRRNPRRFGQALAGNSTGSFTGNSTPNKAQPIAIIGLSGRYPQGWDVDAYWQNLKSGKDCITEVPQNRWDWREYYTDDRNQPGAHYSKWGGFIEGVDEFDPLFFNIVPVGAEYLDPQERLLLQHAWMAIEDAGFTRARLQIPHEGDLNAQVGVYAGVMYGEYQLFGAQMSQLGNRLGFAANPASIANRISYVLNLHGPSMTVDTMCSSSLTAIHLACEDLKQGRTDLALAGGVNISIHPNKYLMISAGQFISGEGQCQSFGEGGDGYIPAEGVGVVVLQRLSEALAARQHIYGVIKGSALSHGGKTNGYTVPNPQAQASAIRRALKNAQVNPAHVSYIEAHGTGTKLGDPIEIAALAAAFGPQPSGSCLVGSAKSNIGHCEAAAGVAGLTKVLLQMRYGQIVPSLHSQKLNPHIDFAKTPFVVNQTLCDWQRPIVDGVEVPRIAGISSFGAGGSNAHIIIEEHRVDVANFNEAVSGQVIVPLSARTEAQLRQKASQLCDYLDHNDVNLSNLAYTLQLGREAMDQRLAVLVSSVAELKQHLSDYLNGQIDHDVIFIGQVKRAKDDMLLINQDDDMKAAIDSWISRKKFAKLMELWVKGLALDWEKLQPASSAGFIPLPGYPFARDRYWVDVNQQTTNSQGSTTGVLHPLLHVNTSDLSGQSYSTLLTGDEFFLRDHQVRQNKMLPAVAYLEMVRSAVVHALPAYQQEHQQDHQQAIEIHKVVWVQPLVVNQPKQVHIALAAVDDQRIDFEIYSAVAEGHPQEVIHAQGQVRLVANKAPKVLDLSELQNGMTLGKPSVKRLYEAFGVMGVEYGATFQGLTSVQLGQDQLLAELSLPAVLESSLAQYVLHPSLMDSALHASMGFSNDLDNPPSEPPLPFALDHLKVFGPCQREMYSWVRFSPDSGSEIVKLDIDLIDLKGNICVQMRGFTSRELRLEDKSRAELLLATPQWHNDLIKSTAEQARTVVVFTEADFAIEQLQQALPNSRCTLAPLTGGGYSDIAKAALSQVKAAMQNNETLQLVVLPSDQQILCSGLAGLLKTARLEKPDWQGQLLLCDSNDPATIAQQLNSDLSEPLVRYHQGERQVQRWQPLTTKANTPVAFEADGVYLITGGLGGLGLLFCREILQQAKNATVILTGRSSFTSDKQAMIAVLPGKVEYQALDLTSLEACNAMLDDIEQRHGKISGIIHSAGMVADGLILSKTEQTLAQVLAPKVTATLNLDAASSHRSLQFMLLFSSVSGAMGNIGQADYAMANGFMDAFAGYRNTQVEQGQRQGHTLSINWPLWSEGGMQLDQAALEQLQRTTGAIAMTTECGMQACYQALASGLSQVLVMQGERKRMLALLQAEQSFTQKQGQQQGQIGAEQPAVATGETVAKATAYLSDLLATQLKLPADQIDPDAALEDYGIDSILAMNLTHQLEEKFGDLSKTLFFEYHTLNQLAGYFAKAHSGQFSATTAVTMSSKSSDKSAEKSAEIVQPTLATRQQISSIRDKGRFIQHQPSHSKRAVAIIGLAGQFPGAEDLDGFWHNLQQGVDCVSEIPAERWDHSRFYTSERNIPGTSYSKWGGFISDVDKFDALFFNISPNEAKLIDPQERLFLQTAWHVLEDAGYSRTGFAGRRVGVYVGVMYGQYELYGAESIMSGQNTIATSSFASIANRVSYYFNFNGPSIALDTMCSSSLTALHLAGEAIASGELDAAIAGGVNLTLHPHKYLNLSQGNFVASDGRCRSFGAGGDGYVPGEGVGAVLLRPLADALDSGDHIYGLIKASTLNHGGKTNGYTVPNPNAQGELIAETLHKANIDPNTLAYLETHGTGTSLGDPIEITGLCKAFEGYGEARQFCPIGSVKSNIGHLESAAGMAALTKVLLQIQHRQLVPSLHAQTLNPNIDFAATPFYVQRSLSAFKPASEYPHRAAISSFGAGGANAHVIVEEYVDSRPATVVDDSAQALLLSASDQGQLHKLALALDNWLEDHPAVNFCDLAYTTQVGRTALNERLVVLCDDVDGLRKGLQHYLAANIDARDLYCGNIKKAASSTLALISGKSGEVFLQSVLESRDLSRMAQLWIAGVAIDWAQLYRQTQPKRLSLPNYPFFKERHWIEPLSADVAIKAAPPQLAAATPGQLLHLAPLWSAQALAELTETVGQTWLIGATAEYELEGISIAVSDNSPEGWRELVTKHKATLPARILYVADQDDFYRLTYLVQALMLQKMSAVVSLVVVANSTQATHVALASWLKTLHLENPNYRGKLLLDPSATQLQAELKNTPAAVEQIRYYQGRRQVQRIEAIKPQPIIEMPFKQAGCYLISGGLGGLGLIFARYLAQHNARLILLGRSSLEDEGKEGAKASLTELEKLGAEVLYIATDVAHYDSLKAAVDIGIATFGRIDGVIHSAGTNDDGFILNKTTAQAEKVLSAKIAGTVNLDRATAECDLDWFVLFSSVAAVVGNPGQCDYAYANGFMDAFAAQRANTRRGKTLSINWPYWQQGGMQMAQADIERTQKLTGLSPMPLAQGLKSFAQLLGADQVQVLSLFGDGAAISRYFSANAESAAKPVVASKSIANRSQANGEDLATRCEAYLKALVAQQTGLAVARIDSFEPFESFGLDSMMINRFNAQLEADLGALPKTLLYEYESIDALSGYLCSAVKAPLTALLLPATAAETAEVVEVVEVAEVTEVVAPVAAVKAEPQAVATATYTAAPENDIHGIAIIGLDGRYPQSNSLEEYWAHLIAGDEMVSEVPTLRWDSEAYFDADPANAAKGKIYSKWGGFIDDVDCFDAEFFNIGATEAQLMDPQERVFLQSAWAVLEDAGYTRDSLKARHPKAVAGKIQGADVGVYVGVTTNTYQMLATEASGEMLTPSAMPWSIANRVSYCLNLQGPSLPVDTACSSSLVALHMACDGIRRQDCQLAIAGGVNLYLHPYKYQSLCHRQMLAKGPKTHSFGADGDGFVASEGVGCVLLKPLQQAVTDRDHIYGVIAGSAFGHCGRSNGYSAPNPNAQAQIIRNALANAQVSASQINYIEAHGTGTQLGDSLEVAAIGQAFGQALPDNYRCPIGSVKANIGHGEAAAGIAGLSKLLLQLRHGQLAPSINANPVNPNIDFARIPLRLQGKSGKWNVAKGKTRRALLNSFGAGGVNACLVIEQAPELERLNTQAKAELIVLSARSAERLNVVVRRLLAFVGKLPALDLARLAYTLQLGRESMQERLAFVAQDRNELLSQLRSFVGNKPEQSEQMRGSLDPLRLRSAPMAEHSDDLAQLGKQWCDGMTVDFVRLHPQCPGRMSLPSYPFAQSRYWITPAKSVQTKQPSAVVASQLHPLIARNASTLKSVCFVSSLSANAYYAADHQVQGTPLFPGAAMVEMATAAGALAAEQRVARITDIVWTQPLPFTHSTLETRIYLKTIGNATEVELTSLDQDYEPVTHFQAQLHFAEQGKAPLPLASKDLKGLVKGANKTLDGQQVYAKYRELGFNYGPTFNTITALHCHQDYALAKLQLGTVCQDSFEDYLLHPTLLDGALQSVIGLVLGSDNANSQNGPSVPFAVDELVIYRSLTSTCYAHVCRADEPGQSRGGVSKFNISLLDENGMVLVAFKHFYVRTMPTHNSQQNKIN